MRFGAALRALYSGTTLGLDRLSCSGMGLRTASPQATKLSRNHCHAIASSLRLAATTGVRGAVYGNACLSQRIFGAASEAAEATGTWLKPRSGPASRHPIRRQTKARTDACRPEAVLARRTPREPVSAVDKALGGQRCGGGSVPVADPKPCRTRTFRVTVGFAPPVAVVILRPGSRPCTIGLDVRTYSSRTAPAPRTM